MNPISLRTIALLSGLVLALSAIILLINQFIYKYPGNNYFPEGTPLLVLILVIFNLGLGIYFKKGSKARLMGRELFYFFTVMSLIALATNAVQLTPFPTIDHSILALEKKIHWNMETLLIWTHTHPYFHSLLGMIYDSLTYQMCILPLFIITTCRLHLIREYYFYLLSTTLVGFGIYYFFPTTAPASIINSSFFTPEQIDTGLKFTQIHHYINPTTHEGGLIAFPSFHAIWALLCVNLLKEWVIPCVILLAVNLLLIVSCVLLGWHYATDILGSFVVLLICYYVLKYCKTLRPSGSMKYN